MNFIFKFNCDDVTAENIKDFIDELCSQHTRNEPLVKYLSVFKEHQFKELE